jgi:murein DD-endopeptidase MepM/ murein hydrolase activator NlpD
MYRNSALTAIIVLFFAVFGSASDSTPLYVSIKPESVTQGEAIMISVSGTTSLSSIKSITFDTIPLKVFLYKNTPTAFYGIDLNKKSGVYKITVTLRDGTMLKQDLKINQREKIEAPLGIPEKLGGNTTEAEKNLIATLARENYILSSLTTGKKSFWTKPFSYPVASPFVTDNYGYSRKTGASTIAHKGTDFRAKLGTPVKAMNRGVVRTGKLYKAYGNTVVIDHGLGVMTMYMHLSKVNVKVGQLVNQGQVIGLSGDTGYAEAPHLHLSLRINNISIDPITFLNLFK